MSDKGRLFFDKSSKNNILYLETTRYIKPPKFPPLKVIFYKYVVCAMTETLSQNTPDITKHSTKDIQATIDATAKKTSLGSVKTLDDAQNVIETAVKKIE